MTVNIFPKIETLLQRQIERSGGTDATTIVNEILWMVLREDDISGHWKDARDAEDSLAPDPRE